MAWEVLGFLFEFASRLFQEFSSWCLGSFFWDMRLGCMHETHGSIQKLLSKDSAQISATLGTADFIDEEVLARVGY